MYIDLNIYVESRVLLFLCETVSKHRLSILRSIVEFLFFVPFPRTQEKAPQGSSSPPDKRLSPIFPRVSVEKSFEKISSVIPHALTNFETFFCSASWI